MSKKMMGEAQDIFVDLATGVVLRGTPGRVVRLREGFRWDHLDDEDIFFYAERHGVPVHREGE